MGQLTTTRVAAWIDGAFIDAALRRGARSGRVLRGGAFICVALVAAAAPTHAQTFAVLAVDTDAAQNGRPAAASTAVRDAMRADGIDVLDISQTKERLTTSRGAQGYPVAGIKARLDKAESVNAALDTEGSIKILQSAVDDLARDVDFTQEKQRLLEEARVRLATRLVASGGGKETGDGETDAGKRATAVMVEALRTNPRLLLDEARFPPKVRKLLQRATEAFKRIATGPLTVTSRPAGASVYLEGREVGKTPLKLVNVIPQGSYRTWCEIGGVKSTTQHITIDERTPDVVVDLQFEGALWPEGPGLKPLAGTTIDEDVARKVGRFVAVQELLLVGIASYDDGEWLYGVRFTAAGGASARRGAVRIDANTSVASAAKTLAAFLGRGQAGADVLQAPVPNTVLPQSTAARAPGGEVASAPTRVAAESEQAGGVPWAIVGGSIAAAAIVALAGGTAAVVYFAPKDGEASTSIRVAK